MGLHRQVLKDGLIQAGLELCMCRHRRTRDEAPARGAGGFRLFLCTVALLPPTSHHPFSWPGAGALCFLYMCPTATLHTRLTLSLSRSGVLRS